MEENFLIRINFSDCLEFEGSYPSPSPLPCCHSQTSYIFCLIVC